MYEKAIEIEEKMLPTNDYTLDVLYTSLGSLYKEIGQYSNALSLFTIAIETKRRILPSNHPELINL